MRLLRNLMCDAGAGGGSAPQEARETEQKVNFFFEEREVTRCRLFPGV